MRKGFIFVMMKTLFLYCFFFVPALKINAQVNLVPNPSFEIYSVCPNNFSQINYAVGWFSPTLGSPDYYNACQTIPWNFGVPYTAGGYQTPEEGNSFAGIIVYGATPAPLREYIQTQLLDTLQPGKSYCVSFYVNLANGTTGAITQIGAYISATAVSSGTALPLPYTPQIISPVGYYLKDSINWMKISGTYIATGGEKYITIGNFKDEISTDTMHFDISNLVSYYYIDEVSVVCCSCDTLMQAASSSLSIPNIFSPNNDGNNDGFKIMSTNIKNLNCKVYNRWGIIVGELKNVNEIWDGRTISGEECVSGVYYYIINATGDDDKKFNEKGFLQLIK
jgi:gliding motility-associated-like protein